ncbi:MAG: pyridoxamine 5'-phosphate oxidase family protein [Actinomyces sp.]|nr:MAG: pyridoxamine 5'-phosphate oxidase family protein [Actinomyces sp.]
MDDPGGGGYSWRRVETEVPDLAARVQARLTAGRHCVLATLAPDGAPRVWGTEIRFAGGELWIGAMPGSAKVRDLDRDPRFALHGPPLDEEMTAGDAKVRGRLERVFTAEEARPFLAELVATGGPPDAGTALGTGGALPFAAYRARLVGMALTRVDHEAGELVVEHWRPGAGVGVSRVR